MATHIIPISHKVGANFLCFERCTKYRYQMMQMLENKNLVEATIRKAAHEHRIHIHIIAVMPDHVHLLVSLPNGITDARALQLLKGRPSYLIFRNREHVRLRYPPGDFWAPGNCSLTVGRNNQDTCFNYIETQQEHHHVAFT